MRLDARGVELGDAADAAPSGCGGRGFALPPVILVGPPGIGKSHFARRLAELAMLPIRMIDVGGGSAGFRISGTEKGWSSEQPGLPVETVLATRIANPVMVVD